MRLIVIHYLYVTLKRSMKGEKKLSEFNLVKQELTAYLTDMLNKYDQLYEVELDKDQLWNAYLTSIPSDKNQIFRVRREYDCSCCRQFIKGIGNVVAIDHGKVISIWDCTLSDPEWNEVFQCLSEFVKGRSISGRFFSPVRKIGTDFNMAAFENQSGEKIPYKFEHFFISLPSKFVYTEPHNTIDGIRGTYRDTRNVFKRGLDEISMDALLTIRDLIAQGSIYRGDGYREHVCTFIKHKECYLKLENDRQKDLYAWEFGNTVPIPVAKIRNTAIGTLLVDLSEGMDLEEAVRKYEKVVAPENYKRSKPIFTKQMLEDAQNTITELGYLESLERRYATADDITVNNILFSNREMSSRIRANSTNLFDALEKEVKSSPKKFDRVEEISVEKFIKDVLPTAAEVEAYVENRHRSNFMSLIAPIHKDSKSMFKWKNNFSWAYSGNVADSMVKQNVKNAGGKVDGVLRFSIQWNDTDEFDRNDNDAHCIEPRGYHIFYINKSHAVTGGMLDIDIINPERNKPAVENITWPQLDRMEEGVYTFFVHCYTGCGGRSGFRAEIEFNGEIYSFDYRQPLKDDERVDVATVSLMDGVFTIHPKLPSNVSSVQHWGVHTNHFTPVTVICMSPNYWDEQNGIGNKHYFFMLKDCVNPELPNAWYSEFLNSELYPQHRKVLEALSSKAHVQESDDQLSGVGFSSTLRNDIVLKIKGSSERVVRVKF